MRALEGGRRDRRVLAAWIIAVSSLAVPPLSLGVLHHYPHYNVVFQSVDVHLAVVGAISACSLAVAIAAARAARRTEQGALLVLAVGCLAVGAFMLAHGLTTPLTMGRPANLWVARFPVVAIGMFAACLLAAATRPDGRLLSSVSRHPRAVIRGAGAVFATIAIVTVAWPDVGIGNRLLPGEQHLWTGVLAAAALALLVAGVVHWRRYALGFDGAQLALVVASWQGVGAAFSLELGELWHLAWWDYHAFLLIGFAAAVYAIVVGARRSRHVDDVLGSIYVTDPLHHIERGYSDALRVLVGAVEARDHHTHGHSARVAQWSVKLGQRLDLRPAQLRTLAGGAYLHDVGKIGVPDQILNKPGKLDDDEWDWIRQHPVVGVDIASRAPSLHGALDMIRHHHERYDGSGYPDRLAGERIPLLARIVAVADVFDALTSERAYRAAWSPERALSHMLAGRRTHFDPDCLDAFLTMLADDGLRPETAGDPAVADAAASACHDHGTNGHADGHGDATRHGHTQPAAAPRE